MSKPVIFETAAILGVKHKIANASILNLIEFVATYDPSTAQQLGQSKFLVYDQTNTPKQGFKTVELDLEMHAFGLRLEPKQMPQHTLDITPQSAAKFKVFKSGGKGKKATIRLKFVVSHSGSPDEAHRMLQYLIDIGSAPGKLIVTPLQAELFGKEERESEKKRKGKKDKPEPVQTKMPETVEEETKPAVAETEQSTAETVAPAEETKPVVQYPKPDENGLFSNTGAVENRGEGKKWAAFIEVLEVEAGFVYGWGARITQIGDETRLLHISTLCSSESLARKNAAENIYRVAQKCYSGATPQVKNVAREVMAWAEPFITNEQEVAAAKATVN